METKSAFRGDQKLPLKSPLAKIEQDIIKSVVPHIPSWLQGYHLTLTTIVWCVGVLIAGYLSRTDIHWLWLSSAMLFMQWFSDSFDGALGRFRDTGIPKWGYYMDHFLDYIFMCCLLLGYSLFMDGSARYMLFLLIPLFGAFMVNSYLSFGATGVFKITFLGMGPTELRLFLILLNTGIIFFGTGFLKPALPWVVPLLLIVLCVVVYRTQKYIWRIDMDEKSRKCKG